MNKERSAKLVFNEAAVFLCGAIYLYYFMFLVQFCCFVQLYQGTLVGFNNHRNRLYLRRERIVAVRTCTHIHYIIYRDAIHYLNRSEC
jgi:hypothetical protein